MSERCDYQVRENIRYCEILPQAPEDDVTYLLLHGLGNSLSFWSQVAPALGLIRRTVAIDIPGFGQSPAPDGSFTLARVAASINNACQALGIKDCVLVAHSMGAFVALKLVALDPARFRRLIVVDGTLGRATAIIRRPWHAFLDPRLGLYVCAQFFGGAIPLRHRMAKVISSSRLVRSLALWPYMASPANADPDVLACALADNGGAGVLRALVAAYRVDYVTLMQGIQCPVDLVWGAQDHLIDGQDLRQAHEHMRIDREMRIELCGHWPMIEMPAVLAQFIGSCERDAAFEFTHYGTP